MKKVAVKERSIIFDGEMIRAILDSRKTQTRRVVKTGMLAHSGLRYQGLFEDLSRVAFLGEGSGTKYDFKNPYGKPGDRLWARETIRLRESVDGRGADGATYGADLTPVMGEGPLGSYHERASLIWHWKGNVLSSRFMPRWASRILLEITDIRVERLRAISEEDAVAEGVGNKGQAMIKSEEFIQTMLGAVYQFAKLWDSLNAKRGYSWNTNPWVWVIEFRRIDEPTS